MTEEKNIEGSKMDTTDNYDPGTSGELSAQTASFRLQSFWTHNPRTWFILAEAQFTQHKITSDSSKYCQIIGSLPPEACETVLDILEKAPVTNKYITLKTALIERNSLSEEKKLESLLDKTEIGDRPPSHVLLHIKSLAGNNFNGAQIQALWLRKMPNFIRVALIPQNDKPLEELAKIADRLNEAVAERSINEVQSSQNYNTPGPSRDYNRPNRENTLRRHQRLQSPVPSSIERRFERIEKILATLTRNSRSRSRGFRTSSRTRSQSSGRTRQTRQNDYCWYHNKFDRLADKCKPPCAHPNSKYRNEQLIDKSSPNQ